MKQEITSEKVASEPVITWEEWQDLLSLDEQEQIARQVGLVDQNDNIALLTNQIASDFEAVCDFRRSQKLFNQYTNGERQLN